VNALSLALVALATLTSAHALGRALALRAGLEALLGAATWPLIAVCAAATACGLALLVRARTHPERLTHPAAALGALLVTAVLAWAFALAFVQPIQRLWFDLLCGLAAGLWSLWMMRPRAPRVLGRLLVAAAGCVFLAELGLRAAAAFAPLPLLARTHDAPRATIERFRCAPGQVHFGFACNERGFFDAPFARDGRARVAVIGDSFGVGVVPHALHYTRVAEELLGLEIANVGVAGCGPPEYLALLVDEVLPLQPEAVVFALFAGNDLEFKQAPAPHAWLRDAFSRERVLLWQVPERLLRRAHDGAALPGAGASVGDEADALWLSDPRLEPPSLSPEAFLRLEVQRARTLSSPDAAALDALLSILEEARALVAPRPFAVLVIPDEFQVEDALWEEIRATAGVELERDAFQRRLLPRLADAGIPALDLLPVLRAVAPLEDGRRHVYHLRDTHWNARGNRAAGLALAGFLRERLGDPDARPR
jgi:hypothetical protein